MLLKVLFWLFVALDSAAIGLWFVLGLAAAGPAKSSPAAVAFALLVVPGGFLLATVWLFVRTHTPGLRVVALLVVAAPALVIGIGRIAGAIWVHQNPGRIFGSTPLTTALRALEHDPLQLTTVRTLLAQGADPNAPGEPVALSELFFVARMLRAYRRNDGKMIVNEKDGGTIAFDLKADPGEQSPVKSRDEDFLQTLIPQSRQLRSLIMQWQKVLPEPKGIENLPDDVRKQLESFGYVGRGNAPEAGAPRGGGAEPGAGSASRPARGPTTRPAATRP